MSLEITAVVNSSKAENEVVKLKATSDVNLSGYAIVDRTFTSTGVPSDEFRHIFVFPSTSVKKGELVYLHTKKSLKGKYDKTTSGTTVIHNFYWGSSHCVWNDKGGDVASLIKYERVMGMRVNAV